jgi:hypothetical protein
LDYASDTIVATWTAGDVPVTPPTATSEVDVATRQAP